MQSSARTGADQVARGAREAVDKRVDLTPDQRAKAYAIIEETSGPMAAEIGELHRALPVKALVTDMARAVYVKYFTSAEIELLASFYSSKGFQKLARLQIQLSEESARTGQSKDALQAKYLAGMTPQDNQTISTFGNSAIGQKQQRVGPALAADMRSYLYEKTNADFEAITTKYAKLTQTKLQEALQP
jgi:hypothetical protein